MRCLLGGPLAVVGRQRARPAAGLPPGEHRIYNNIIIIIIIRLIVT